MAQRQLSGTLVWLQQRLQSDTAQQPWLVLGSLVPLRHSRLLPGSLVQRHSQLRVGSLLPRDSLALRHQLGSLVLPQLWGGNQVLHQQWLGSQVLPQQSEGSLPHQVAAWLQLG